MALCHFPNLSSTSQNLCSSSFIRIQESYLKGGSHHFRPCRCPVLACAAKKSRASKKRVAKTTKSNADLCNELREFISTAGLPENHVPTTKELSEHGRKDLANIVRRRGYKVITELLMDPHYDDTCTEGNSTETLDSSNSCNEVSPEGLDEGSNMLAEDDSLLGSSSMVENYISSANGAVTTNSCVQTQIHKSLEPSVRSLHEKARNFVHSGEIDTVEDPCEIEDEHMLDAFELSYGMPNANGADAGAAVSQEATPLSIDPFLHRDNVTSWEGLNRSDFDENLASEVGELDNQTEINRLKAILHQKEMELTLIKQHIEEEKLAISILQNKAISEVGNAQSIISAKNVELRVAEESLSGLKEVKIEYWGNGENVEVAGSFNGWHHQIKMDLDPSSNMINPTGTREFILWSTILWLYPGVYEIKFIVDGHWRIDSQRETITRGNITNNILRVER